MPGEVIAHAQFLEARERHRTAERAVPPPVAAASDEPPTLDGEPADAPPLPVTETTRSALAATAAPPRLGPAGRWRVRRPSHDR
jgi:hypothetical protein